MWYDKLPNSVTKIIRIMVLIVERLLNVSDDTTTNVTLENYILFIDP